MKRVGKRGRTFPRGFIIINGIADTHALIWYLRTQSRLSPTAKAFIDQSAAEVKQVGLSAITLVEIIYLIEKERIPKDPLTDIQTTLDLPNAVLVEMPFDRRIAEVMPQIARSQVPDLPARIIAATALYLGVPLISRDAKIRISGVPTIW